MVEDHRQLKLIPALSTIGVIRIPCSSGDVDLKWSWQFGFEHGGNLTTAANLWTENVVSSDDFWLVMYETLLITSLYTVLTS